MGEPDDWTLILHVVIWLQAFMLLWCAFRLRAAIRLIERLTAAVNQNTVLMNDAAEQIRQRDMMIEALKGR